MEALPSALEERKMYGTNMGVREASPNKPNIYRGAYCSMVMMSLLSLPLELPPNALARKVGLTSFSDRLPQYLSRCRWHGIFTQT